MFTLLLFLFLAAGGSAALGVHMQRALRINPDTGVFAATTLMSLGVQSTIGVVVGSVSLRLAGLCCAVLQCAAIGALLTDGTLKRSWMRWRARSDRFTRAQAAFLCVTGLVLAATFFGVFAPVTAWDAGVAHLAVAAQYASQDRIDLVPGNNYCAYPQLMQTAYALALDFRAPNHEGAADGFARTESLANITAWLYAALACAAAFGLGERLGGRICGAIAAANLAVTPIFVDQASSPLIDLPFTATVLAAMCMLYAWHNDKRWGFLMLAGALAGSGCGIRHTGYLVVFLFAVGVFLYARERRSACAALFLLVALAFASPWLWHAWRVSGDPVYPFFLSRFAGSALPDVDVARVGAHSSVQGRDLFRLLLFPWSLTMNTHHYGGWATSPGALWLALGVVGAATGGKRARAIGAFSAAGLIAIFFFQRYARYALPFLAPMMVVAALPFATLPRARRVIVAVLIVSYGFGLALAAANTARKLPVIAGRETRDMYLKQHVERYFAMDWIAMNTPADARILSADPRGYYLNRSAYTNFEGLKAIASWSAARQYEWLRSRHIAYFLYPRAYVERSPAFRETGVGKMLDGWRADNAHFHRVVVLDAPDPRTRQDERVEIYEFRP